MTSIAVALTFAIVLPASAARAAPPRGSEQSDRELQAASGLDLSREWASYARHKRSGSFAEYVDRRFRIRRDLGRGLVVAGAALVFASAFFFLFGSTDHDCARACNATAGTSVGLGGGLLIPGAVLLGVYARRLDRLDAATDDLGLDARERASRNGGLGLRFAF